MPNLPVTLSPLHVRFGEFELDELNARLLRDGTAIALSPTPFNVLCALVRQPGTLLTKHALLDQIWGHRFVSDSVLKGAISEVRTVLGDDPRQPRYIETVPRRGYRFVALSSPFGELTGDTVHTPAQLTEFKLELQSASSFIGRAAELARLQSAWESTSRKSPAVVWIAGEPGIGKTTLIEHFINDLSGVVVVRGQCVQPYGDGEPYLPVLEALAKLARRDPEVAILLRTVAPTWLLQLPWLCTSEQREALLRELVGTNPQRMLREMGEFLDRYSESRPLLLVTEDMHWADRSTIQLMEYFARRNCSGRLMWLGSFRLTEVIALDHPMMALRHELRLQGICEEIVLDAFSEAEVGAYLAEQVPRLATNEKFVCALHERTEGVPLFVASMAREAGALVARGEIAKVLQLVSTTVPENLTALIDYYVSRLSPQRRQLLVAAAVCGMEFRLDTLAHVLGNDVSQLGETCDELAREQLWLAASASTQENGKEKSYFFRHALFRQVLYERPAATVRAELHGKVGSALEAEHAAGQNVAAIELATHFDRGHMPLMALRYYGEAARIALLHLSPTECMSLTARALGLMDQVPPGAERSTLELTLATLHGVAAVQALGAGDEARTAYVRACALLGDVPHHPMSGLALHGLGFVLDLRAEYSEALATARRAKSLAAKNDDPLLTLAAYAVQGQVLMMQGHPLAARKALDSSIPALERASPEAEQSFIGFVADPQVTVLAMSSLPLTQLGQFKQARGRLQQAYTRARVLAQPMALLVTLWFDALFEIRRGDAARVGAIADEMKSLVDRSELAQGKTAYRWFRGWADVHQGEPAQGFRNIREAYEENCGLGMVSGGSETLGYAAEALVALGDIDGAQEQLRQALDIVHNYGERIYLPQLLMIEAVIAQSRGDSAASETSIRHAVIEARAQGAPWLELLAVSELCKRAKPAVEDLQELTMLVNMLTEANDTSQMSIARELIKRAHSE